MSTYLALATALGVAVAVGLLAVLVARVVTRSDAADHGTPEESGPAPAAPRTPGDRSVIGTRAVPALMGAATTAAVLPLTLWGLVLRDDAHAAGALTVGLLVLFTAGVGAAHVLRRRDGLR